jgi:hypothetical protein
MKKIDPVLFSKMKKENVFTYFPPPNIPCIASPIPPKGFDWLPVWFPPVSLPAVVAFVWFPCAYDVLTKSPTDVNSDSTNVEVAINKVIDFIEI